MSPGGPYSPGMRGSLQRQQSMGMDAKMESVGQGEIQMQSFNEGLPPPPPVSHSWKRIDRWMEDNYEELFENLGFGATVNDVNELEHELDCTLPQEVRESLQIHDGQERGGMPTGVIFGCMLLDCEEIMQEWQNWRTVNEAYFSEQQRTYEVPQAPIKAFAGSSASAVPLAQASHNTANPAWKQELQDKQDSQPPNSIQKAYAHPAWIPLARDWGGNNIAVDLAPGPTGKWGQIILMGRDYDCKYVVARSWSAFLATVADDMATEKWFIDEESKELKLREFKQPGVEPAYIDILRWRTDQKFGRKKAPRKSLRINSNVAGHGQQNGYSPYGSPTSANGDDRGRSPKRYSNHHGKAPASSSPRALVGSPLAKVTEELQGGGGEAQRRSLEEAKRASKESKLVSVDSPVLEKEEAAEKRASFPLPRSRLSEHMLSSDEMAVVDAGVLQPKGAVDVGVEAAVKGGALQDEEEEDDGEMKEVHL